MRFKFNYFCESKFDVSGICRIGCFVIFGAWENYYLKRYINDYYAFKQLDICIDNELYKIQSLEKFVQI